MNIQKLFNHLSINYGLVLLESELFEIIDIIKTIINDSKSNHTLLFCDNCLERTVHLNGVCKKCKSSKNIKNQINIVKKIADDMIGIGGVPSNNEFYEEYNMRIKEALQIQNKS